MDNFGAGYFAGRRHERRRIARMRAGQPTPLQPRKPWVTLTAREVRRLVLLLVVLLVVLALLFTLYAIGYGIQHHLIYMAPSR